MVGVILIGLVLVIVVLFCFVYCILLLLNLLVDSVCVFVSGDFGVCVSVEENLLGEVVILVEDFNVMVCCLQYMESECVMWYVVIVYELCILVMILCGCLQGLVEGVFQLDELQFCSLFVQVEGLFCLIEDLCVLSLFDNVWLDVCCVCIDVVVEVYLVMMLVDLQFCVVGFVLELEISCEEYNVYCDFMCLCQVLLVLLENVCCYVSLGKVWIVVYDMLGYVQVVIEDEGLGIDFGLYVDIFILFMCVDGLCLCQGGGSGFGLVVVKVIVDVYGGCVYCIFGSCGGSCFVIELLCQQLDQWFVCVGVFLVWLDWC